MRRSLFTGLSLLALAACQTLETESPSSKIVTEVETETIATTLVAVPPVFETVTETIVVQPKSVTYEVIPGKFEWVDGEIPGESIEYVEIPPEYETIEESIVVQEASTELISVPPAYETLADGSRVVKMPASTTERVIPAVTKMETRRVIKTPARVEEVTVSNKIEDGRTLVMVEPPRTVEKTVPAITKTVERRVVKTPARTVEVLASGGETIVSPTREILASAVTSTAFISGDHAASADLDSSGETKTEPASKIKPEPKPVSDTPKPQAGLLTAGDYDDVLNPHLYMDYAPSKLGGELLGRNLPNIDTGDRIVVRVVDRLGKPVPLSRVELAEGGVIANVQTGANGMAYFYDDIDGIDRPSTISVEGPDGRRLTRKLSSKNLGKELVIDLSVDRQLVDKLDLLLTIDSTGSMQDEISYLKAEISGIVGQIAEANPGVNIRTGLIVYRDKTDIYVVRDFAFTDDLDGFRKSLDAQDATGGGDMPEAMHAALDAGLKFEWREDAVKVNLLVADAPPHRQDLGASWEHALAFRKQGIHMVPVAASGVDPTAEFLMRSMALVTGGRYLFLTDDSGIGNAHAEPTVDCYVVTPLNGLVTRVVSGLVKGERIEPEGEQVIRTVGNYRAGVCAKATLELASNQY